LRLERQREEEIDSLYFSTPTVSISSFIDEEAFGARSARFDLNTGLNRFDIFDSRHFGA
jgi:hypothetical protein